MPSKKRPSTRKKIFKQFESPKEKEEALRELKALGLIKEPEVRSGD